MKMEEFNLSGNNLKSKIYWAILLGASLVLFGLAAFRLDDFSLQQFGVLAVTLAVSVFANQHQIKVPGTAINFSAKEIVVFWGTIWLGVPGGVFLAVVSSLVRFNVEQKNKFKWLFGIFSNICTAFASASVFYLVLQYFAGFRSAFVGEETIIWRWLIAATVLMAVSHYILSAILNTVF